MKHLTIDERAEWNALMDAANAAGSSSGERGEEVVRLLADATQARRPWAEHVRGSLLLEAATKHAKRRFKVANTTLVSVGTAERLRSMAGGVKVKATNGRVVDQQKLFVDMTWNELESHVDMLKRQLRELGITVAADRKLLKLRDQYPSSSGPGDACRLAGISIEEVLAA